MKSYTLRILGPTGKQAGLASRGFMKREYCALMKLENFNYKRLTLALVVLYYSSCIFAQDKELPYSGKQSDGSTYVKAPKFDYEQIYSTNHWNFLLRPLVYPGTDLHFSHPLITMRLVASPGFQLGWMYQFNIRRRWGIQLGLNAEAGWLQYTYSIKKAYYSGLRQDDGQSVSASSYWDNFSYSIPIYAEYHLPLYDKHNAWLLDFRLGVDFKAMSNVELISSHNSTLDTAGQKLKTFSPFEQGSGDWKFAANFHASVGFSFILPNKQILNFAVLGSYCPFFKSQGTFHSFPIYHPKLLWCLLPNDMTTSDLNSITCSLAPVTCALPQKDTG
ncbi:MAG: outer membrane beta-barrel protein [Bacteroidetes bacterium]|nr:outer membrane beta-barrel protein [Bacteroidota bacterium]